MRLAESLVEIPTPRVRFPNPAWILKVDCVFPTFKWIVLFFSPPLSGLFLFAPIFKWIVPRSYEIEVSHMGKTLILYRQRYLSYISKSISNDEQ